MSTAQATIELVKLAGGESSYGRLHLNENPPGLSQRVINQLKERIDQIYTYPDPTRIRLRQAIADYHGVDIDMVAIGNGADEIILNLSLVFGGQGTENFGAERSFSSYRVTTERGGGVFRGFKMKNWMTPLDEMAKACNPNTRLMFICNPHNPMGVAIPEADIQAFMGKLENSCDQAIPIFDEAYAEFCDQDFYSMVPSVRDHGQRAIVLRTFSKAFGLAGVRVGYAIGPKDLIGKFMNEVSCYLPFSVNTLAQEAAILALADREHLCSSTNRVKETKQAFCRELDRIGISYLPSQTNFVCLETPILADEFASRLRESLKILCRDLKFFEMPYHVRMTIGSPEQMLAVVKCLEECQKEVANPA